MLDSADGVIVSQREPPSWDALDSRCRRVTLNMRHCPDLPGVRCCKTSSSRNIVLRAEKAVHEAQERREGEKFFLGLV